MCCDAACIKEDPNDTVGFWYICDYGDFRSVKMNRSTVEADANPNFLKDV